MPRLINGKVPAYRLHKQSGQAIVTLSGRDVLLGDYGSEGSKKKYEMAISEWLAAEKIAPGKDEGNSITIVEMVDLYPELRELRQFVGWRSGNPRENGKRPKLPVNPKTGKAAKPNDEATWSGINDAQHAVARFGLEGIGFMFRAGGGLAGIDLDDCMANGTTNDDALEVVRSLNSYSEISPSGTGIKIIVKGSKPENAGSVAKNRCGCRRVEVYDSLRFLLTDKHFPGTPSGVEDRQAQLDSLCRQLWPVQPTLCKNDGFCTVSNDEPVGGVNNVGTNYSSGVVPIAGTPTNFGTMRPLTYERNRSAAVTEIYAEVDRAKATEVIKKIG
jgi:hypothetical protein